MIIIILVVSLSVAYGLPADDPVIQKLDEIRYQYMPGSDGTAHLVDTWIKVSDLKASARFNPDNENVYHLFTRQNPSLSQPMVFGNPALVGSHFNPNRRTIVIVHGWNNHAQSTVNAELVPAFLAAEDVNVVVVDWSVGATTLYPTAVINTATSGAAVARFISWLNEVTGARIDQYHLAGHSLGGHQVGIIGRNLNGQVPYITALDLAMPGWITNNNRFTSTDGVYTEAIHTNVVAGFLDALADTDFYPNGGVNMPGCSSSSCDHDRCFYYFAESLHSGGFNSRRCATLLEALRGQCSQEGGVPMGGLRPKTGSIGIFHLETNAAPPFSMG